MRKVKTMLLVALLVPLALLVFAALAPKTAHAIVATMVQVVNTVNTQIMNTSANPVPTLGAEANNYFIRENWCNFDSSQRCQIFPMYNFPDGRLGVIETISAKCGGASSGNVEAYVGIAMNSFIYLPFAAGSNVATVNVKGYSPSFFWFTAEGGSNGAPCHVTVTGYTVPAQ
jgi:hypothetical protein